METPLHWVERPSTRKQSHSGFSSVHFAVHEPRHRLLIELNVRRHQQTRWFPLHLAEGWCLSSVLQLSFLKALQSSAGKPSPQEPSQEQRR